MASLQFELEILTVLYIMTNTMKLNLIYFLYNFLHVSSTSHYSSIKELLRRSKRFKFQVRNHEKFGILIFIRKVKIKEVSRGHKVVAVMLHKGIESLPQTLNFKSLYL